MTLTATAVMAYYAGLVLALQLLTFLVELLEATR